MSDNRVLTLQSLLDKWKEATDSDEALDADMDADKDAHPQYQPLQRRREARLIVIVDSEHAHKWKKPLSRTKEGFVAIQTFYPRDLTSKNRHDSDPEDVDAAFHGAFTQGVVH